MEEVIIGIARISRKTQNIQRQIRNIKKIYPNARIIKITCSGARVIGYKEFEKVVNEAKQGNRNKKYEQQEMLKLYNKQYSEEQLQSLMEKNQVYLDKIASLT